jgi:ribosomal protein S8
MSVVNILANLLVSLKTSYINNNVYAYTKYNLLCVNILFLLYKDGLISNYSIDFSSKKIKIKLKYLKNKPLLTNFVLLSKPSHKIFSSYNDLLYLNTKYDYFFISTSLGLLSSREFIKNPKIGGQLLFACNLLNA